MPLPKQAGAWPGISNLLQPDFQHMLFKYLMVAIEKGAKRVELSFQGQQVTLAFSFVLERSLAAGIA